MDRPLVLACGALVAELRAAVSMRADDFEAPHKVLREMPFDQIAPKVHGAIWEPKYLAYRAG